MTGKTYTETELQAAVAAALEAAAEHAEGAWFFNLPSLDEKEPYCNAARAVRAMITDDARAALERIKAEAREEGMREAAQRAALMIELGTEWPATTRGKVDAILAAIQEVRK